MINNNYSLAMIFILSLAFSTFMIEIIGHQLQQKNILIEQDIESSISMSLSEKVMTLQYERLESKAKLDEYQFAKQCLANGGITKFTNMIVIIVSSIMTITSIIFIVMKLNDWVIYLIMIVTIINMVCEIKRVNYEYHITQKGAVIERNLYYARDELTRNAYAKEVHLFQLSPFIQSKIKYYLEAFSNLQKESATKTVKLFGWTYIVSGIQMLVTYGYLVIICFKREISIGDFSLYITAMTTFCSVLSMIIRTLMEIVSQNKYLVALVNFLEQNEEWEQKELMTLPQDLESITFEGVTFQYPKAEEVSLEDFTFCFKQGKKYSIVGANGAGKTTLIKLMLGFYTPQKGEIKANNINVRHFKYKDYMKLFAPVFQDFNILGYSIAENIAMNTQIEDEKVYKVIEKVGLKSKINKLRNNIKTPMNRELNTEGTEFSIGQQQKLALARALYKQAPVYILDEPTAALSPQAEYDLYQKFEKITKNKMVFYISHRLSSCKLCDQIIVLDKGKIVEYGTWMELMDKRGLFYEMFLVQAEQFK
ncbi:MAG: ABC transporter ATP-binding protein [Romboutsia sp.]